MGISYAKADPKLYNNEPGHEFVVPWRNSHASGALQGRLIALDALPSHEDSRGNENIGTFRTDEVAICEASSQGSLPSC